MRLQKRGLGDKTLTTRVRVDGRGVLALLLTPPWFLHVLVVNVVQVRVCFSSLPGRGGALGPRVTESYKEPSVFQTEGGGVMNSWTFVCMMLQLIPLSLAVAKLASLPSKQCRIRCF